MTDKRVIERLYSEFSACLLRERMDFCEYCDTAEYEGALHGELSTLAPELVDKYIWDAIHHTGDEANFKHFVPRIYELLWQGELPFADPEMVLGRLAHAEWEAWSVSQQESIRLVLDGLWDDALRQDDPTCWDRRPRLRDRACLPEGPAPGRGLDPRRPTTCRSSTRGVRRGECNGSTGPTAGGSLVG